MADTKVVHYGAYERLAKLLQEAFEGQRKKSDGMSQIDFGEAGMTIEGVLCQGVLKVHFVPVRDNPSAPATNKKERRWYGASILDAEDGRSLTVRGRAGMLAIKPSAVLGRYVYAPV